MSEEERVKAGAEELWQGMAAARRGEWKEAYDALCEAAARRETDAEVQYELGRLLFHMAGEDLDAGLLFDDETGTAPLLDHALKHFQEALGIDPLHVRAWNSVGRLHASREDYKAAVEALQNSLDIRPNQRRIRRLVGELKPQAGKEPNPIHCPRCQEPLEAAHIDDLLVERCTTCEGTWFDHGEIYEATRPSTDELKMTSKELRETVEQHIREMTHVYRGHETLEKETPCPLCGEDMERKSFGLSSGVLIDRCPRHGIWLDGGDFDKCREYQLTRLAEYKKKTEWRDYIDARGQWLYNPFLSLARLVFGWGSGEEEPIIEDFAEELTCPRCGDQRLQKDESQDVVAAECPSCEGKWFRRGDLYRASLPNEEDKSRPTDLMRIRAEAYREAASAVSELGTVDLEAPVDCPVCRRTCTRYEFGIKSGVVLDRCADHGIWADKGELETCHGYQLEQLADTRERMEDLDRRGRFLANPLLGMADLVFGWSRPPLEGVASDAQESSE